MCILKLNIIIPVHVFDFDGMQYLFLDLSSLIRNQIESISLILLKHFTFNN